MRTQAAGVSAWALATAAGILLVYGGLSRRLDRIWVSAPIFFLSAGLIVGNKGLGWIGLGSTSEQVRVLAEVTLTLVLFADASRINVPALRREFMLPVRLLGIGLPLTILAGWGLGAVLFGSFSGVEVLILAVILAPTDAALGQAVVTDTRVPSRIRQGLNVESGLNDGICVPLLLIALAVAEAEGGSETGHAAFVLVVEAIGYGVLFGVIAGVVGGLVMRLAGRHNLLESGWRQILPLATAGLAYGLAAPLGGSGFIAAFVAGFAFGTLHRDAEGETTYLLDELGGLTNSVTFLVFGAAIVGTVLADLSWRAALYGFLSLTVVRMLPVAVSLFGTQARRRTVAFVGWFGPRGLASIVFTVIALEHGTLEHASAITVAVVFTIVLSVYAHGLSAKPLTDRYARWYRAHTEARLPRMESVHAPTQRWRRSQVVPVARVDDTP
jgi:NhaP-type Na+/H+ or K+/H+ antiporter